MKTISIGEDGEKIAKFVSLFDKPDKIIAMNVNGRLRSLNYVANPSKKLQINPVYNDSISGEAMIRRTIVFVMSMAAYRLSQKKEIDFEFVVKHPLELGYFCTTNKEFSVEQLKKLKIEMDSIIKEGFDIKLKTLYYQDALDYFKKTNSKFTLKLLQSLAFYDVDVESCEGFMVMHHRSLCSNTSHLQGKEFNLVKKSGGFNLTFEFIKKSIYYQPKEMKDKEILQIHKNRTEFIERVNVKCVGDINQKVIDRDIEDFITLNNTFQDLVMNSLVRKIEEAKKKGCRLILIAGPSSSGKTTFASKLRTLLLCKKIPSQTLSVDNYFVNRVDTPLDENGAYDFENIKGIRINKLNGDIKKLLDGEDIWTPVFNFHTGTYDDKGEKKQVSKDTMLIMEGIHCLNDDLLPGIDGSSKFKIFIAPFTPINLDDRNYISNKTIRLIRRMVRDYKHRGYSPSQTIRQWNSVLQGEHKYIFPFLSQSDFIFNSALDYEIGVLKRYAKPLLQTIKPNEKEYDKAQELLNFLKKFIHIPNKFVPRDSLLQEFIGAYTFY